MTACPQCESRLGNWRFRIVHSIDAQRWYYKCDCGYESRKVKTEKELEGMVTK